MTPENVQKYRPPYISPVSFRHLLEILQQNQIPGRIDRNFLNERFSGSASTQVMAAMHFLNLMDSNGVPTHHLRLLVDAQGDEKAKRLRDVCNAAYAPVFTNETMDPRTATFTQLEDFFTSYYRVDGDVRRKCLKFFVSLAKDAKIDLSPHIAGKGRAAYNSSTVRPPVKKQAPKATKPVETPHENVKPHEPTGHAAGFMDKFPNYDPTWTTEQKRQWVEDITTFFTRIYPEFKK